jgi:hypothetical protein
MHGYFARLFGFRLMVHKWLLGHLDPSAPWWASNFSCYLFYSWFLPENINQAKGIECSQYKSTAAIFSSRLPICPVCFHLVMPMHVLSPCYARYEHARGIKRYVTYYLAFYVRLRNIDEANGQTGGKNSSSTFILTAFISFGLFNVFRFCLKQVRLSAKLAKLDQHPELTDQTQGFGHQDCEDKFAVEKLHYKTLG